jgi:hypothetical protein
MDVEMPATDPELPPQIEDKYVSMLAHNPAPPKTVNIVPLRFEGVKHRKETNATKWRHILTEEAKVQPISVFHETPTTVVLLVKPEDMGPVTKLMAAAGRQPTNPNPYARRDGKSEPLTEETVARIAERMSKTTAFERTRAGRSYLREQICVGLRLLQGDIARQELLKRANLNLREAGEPKIAVAEFAVNQDVTDRTLPNPTRLMGEQPTAVGQAQTMDVESHQE